MLRQSVSTPLETNTKLVKIDVPKVDAKMYQSALGGLMYAMLATCPDLAYAVGALSKHTACPGQAHFAVLKRVYHYLHGTMDTRLVYRKTSELSLLGYVDADWAGDVNDRCSISGYIFITAGGATSWSSRKQPSVALLSTEAEYMAAAAATKEATWLKVLFLEIKLSLTCTAVKLFIDNQSAMSLAKNATFHDWTKHIAIHHHYIREKVDEGEIVLEYLPTAKQVADILTKPLSREKHIHFIEGMGLII